jgi:hypothetical protein
MHHHRNMFTAHYSFLCFDITRKPFGVHPKLLMDCLLAINQDTYALNFSRAETWSIVSKRVRVEYATYHPLGFRHKTNVLHKIAEKKRNLKLHKRCDPKICRSNSSSSI